MTIVTKRLTKGMGEPTDSDSKIIKQKTNKNFKNRFAFEGIIFLPKVEHKIWFSIFR